jgi:di/tricarboxylate transporter
MTAEHIGAVPLMTALSMRQKLLKLLLKQRLIGAILGPITGVLIWWLPLGLVPRAQATCAIVAFMLVYWMTEPIEHGITALIGCYVFWALQVVPFPMAFSGFVSTSPWFVFGALLMGEAVARTGLANASVIPFSAELGPRMGGYYWAVSPSCIC